MPLYEYLCGTCGLKFEELMGQRSDSDIIPCRSCGEIAKKQISAFAPVISGGSTNETVDMVVGREANKRWQTYHDNQSKRHGDKLTKLENLPRSKDGKYMPVMGLGDKKTVKKRTEYVGALQEHRKNRRDRKIPQFNAAGAF